MYSSLLVKIAKGWNYSSLDDSFKKSNLLKNITYALKTSSHLKYRIQWLLDNMYLRPPLQSRCRTFPPPPREFFWPCAIKLMSLSPSNHCSAVYKLIFPPMTIQLFWILKRIPPPPTKRTHCIPQHPCQKWSDSCSPLLPLGVTFCPAMRFCFTCQEGQLQPLPCLALDQPRPTRDWGWVLWTCTKPVITQYHQWKRASLVAQQ